MSETTKDRIEEIVQTMRDLPKEAQAEIAGIAIGMSLVFKKEKQENK